MVEAFWLQSPDRNSYHSPSDDGSDAAPGAVLSEVDATSSDLDHFADGEFQMGEVDSGTSNRTHSVGDGFPMESVDAPSSNLPRGYRHRSPGLHVVCSYFGFQITLPYALFSDVKIAGMYWAFRSLIIKILLSACCELTRGFF